MTRPMNIAICGSGIGGLAASIMLARAGHRITLIDRFDAPRPIGSGLMLQATGLAVLYKLGLTEEIEQLSSPLTRLWGLSTPSGRTVLDVRFEKLRPGLTGLGIQRPALFGVLHETATSENIDIETTRDIRGVCPDTGRLEFQTGPSRSGFDLVVDAMGVRSPLTRVPRRELAYGALWTTLDWPEDSPFKIDALEQRYRGARQMAGVMASGRLTPDSPKSLTYFWSIRGDSEAAWRAASLGSWKQYARALWPETEMLLDQITDHDQLTFARYRHRTHPRPVSGPRLVHIGDAWHAASPQLGQGANMALLDAYALALALEQNADTPAALAAYQKLRTSHVRIYQLMSWLFTPVYQGDGWLAPLIRDYLAAPISRIPPAPMALAAMVSGAFGSPLKRLGLRS